MNERVRSHFDGIEARLIECPVILSYEIIRRDISTPPIPPWGHETPLSL